MLPTFERLDFLEVNVDFADKSGRRCKACLRLVSDGLLQVRVRDLLGLVHLVGLTHGLMCLRFDDLC